MSAHLPRAVARRLDRLAWRAHLFHRYAHHPLCREYSSELVSLGRRARLCRGCTLMGVGAVLGVAVGAVTPVSPWIWLFAAACSTALSFAPVTRHGGKLVTRLAPGLLLAAGVSAGIVSRSPVGFAVAAASLLVTLGGFVAYRRRGPNRTPCETCSERILQPECRGFRPIMQRERAFQRVANRVIARSENQRMSYVEIPLHRLAIALALIALALLVSRRTKLGLERDLLWGTVRCAVQLIAIGYVLVLLFGHERVEWVLLVLAVMVTAAAATSARRVEHGPGARVLFPYALVAIASGAAVALVPVFAFVIAPKPWFEARYLIPVSGMMLSSAMNVVAQVFERLFSLAHSESAVIEQSLALGASPSQAMERYVRAAVRAALIPTINGLLTVGLVALPGMMTGQILSGTAPDQAVRYQIVIMYQLVAVAAVAGLLAAIFARRMLFTPREQLAAFPNG